MPSPSPVVCPLMFPGIFSVVMEAYWLLQKAKNLLLAIENNANPNTAPLSQKKRHTKKDLPSQQDCVSSVRVSPKMRQLHK